MSVERKKLLWEIKKELYALTAHELFELTRHIELPGLDSSTVNESDEESSLCDEESDEESSLTTSVHICKVKPYWAKKTRDSFSC